MLQPSPSELDEEEELQGFGCHPGATPAPLAQRGMILGAGSPCVDAKAKERGGRWVGKPCQSINDSQSH